MKRNLIRYQTHPDRADENQKLIEGVFAELADKRPEGVRYVAMRLPDDTFYHLVMVDDGLAASPIPQLGAFKVFQGGVGERCIELPQTSEVTIVGSYRMVGE